MRNPFRRFAEPRARAPVETKKRRPAPRPSLTRIHHDAGRRKPSLVGGPGRSPVRTRLVLCDRALRLEGVGQRRVGQAVSSSHRRMVSLPR